MEHSVMDVQWETGNSPLTQQLVMIRGYIMQNTTQQMILEVPLFSVGYRYEVLSAFTSHSGKFCIYSWTMISNIVF